MRYPGEVRWTTHIRQALSQDYRIIEEGMNGRGLPTFPKSESFLSELMEPLTDNDFFMMMLGTNDILLTDHPDADAAIYRMEKFLDFVADRGYPFRLVIIGPPHIAPGIPQMQVYYESSLDMNSGFRLLCEERGIAFFDAGNWDIQFGADEVHFSEEGHREFAEKMLESLQNIGI